MSAPCHHSLSSQNGREPEARLSSAQMILLSLQSALPGGPPHPTPRLRHDDTAAIVNPQPQTPTPSLKSLQKLMLFDSVTIRSAVFHPARFNLWTLCSWQYHHISPWPMHSGRKKRQKWNSTRWTILARELPQSHTSRCDKMRMVPHQRRVTYYCQAAFGQSVLWYNMCVNDNVKGYCHASLVTQNTSRLWKSADH